ncbi:MAG: LuxR C-terminal-related transcriptional regulator [Alphaproteobacteria bacterium]|nr:LuxR C-terminal-related transcriptional regulator [Alphaproteobacteria bacterium]
MKMFEAEDYEKRIHVRKLLSILTKKQYDVLACLLFETACKSIGKTLHISNRTVESHLQEIFRKMEVKNKNDLIKLIRLHGEKQIQQDLKQRFLALKKNKSEKSKVRKFSKFWLFLFIGIIIIVITSCLFFSKGTAGLCKLSNSVYLLERNYILRKLQKTTPNFEVKVICGHGGAGKTTIAREYLRKSNYKFKYEINAESFNSLNEGMLEFAYSLAKTKKQQETLEFLNGIENAMIKLRQISTFVYTCLRDTQNWCLLFDNVDDFYLLNQTCFNTMPDIESMSNGQILITTRNYKPEIHHFNFDLIEVGELSSSEKEELFTLITGKSITKNVKRALNDIPSYPLDVSCLSYYVKNLYISTEDYVKQLKTDSKAFWHNNRKILAANTNYPFTRNEIITKLITQIVSIDPQFKDILFVISFMDSQNIPVKFLRDICNSSKLDELIFHLSKFGIVTFTKDTISFHRSTFAHMAAYLKVNLSNEEKNLVVRKLTDACTPYEKFSAKKYDYQKTIEHIKRIYRNLDNIFGIDDLKIKFAISLGSYVKEHSISTIESIPYFADSLEINQRIEVLNNREKQQVKLLMGEACVIANENEKALSLLRGSYISSPFEAKYATKYANNHILMGMVQMRSNQFNQANKSFDESLRVLQNISENTSQVRLLRAKTYLNTGLNYFLYYINKPEMWEAIKMMNQAVDEVSSDLSEEAIKIMSTAKIRMAGAYNSVKEYQTALNLVNEAEMLLKKLKKKDNNYFCSLGMILMERGHAILRLNRLNEAREILKKAHELFDKTMIGDHVSRFRMQEAETLVRLGLYEEAYKNCMEVIEIKDKEKNDYNELFFCTACYNAAVIKYKTGDYLKSLEHFKAFINNVRPFCKRFATAEQVKMLEKEGAFRLHSQIEDIPTYLKQALLIFKTVCLDGSEFISDYVQKNYEDSKKGE